LIICSLGGPPPLQSQCATMKVLLVCLGLLVVVSLGRGEALADNHEELSLKTLEASEVKDQVADISSIRNSREAKKNDGPKNGRRKTKKGKDRKSRKQSKQRKQRKEKKNKKKKSNIKKRRNKKPNAKKRRKTKNAKRQKGKKKNSDKRKKTKQTRRKKRKQSRTNKKDKRTRKQGSKKKIKRTQKEKKSRQSKNKNKSKTRKDRKKKRKLKKIKQTARKRKMKQRKAKRNRKLGRQSSCGTEQVNDTCLENAVNALNFEKNQIQNFYKQKARLTNHNKTKSNKLGKKGEFAEAAKYLLQALGGNISAPTCGEVGKAQKARSAKSASDTYEILTNCSASIKEACTMPKKTFNATMKEKLDNCAVIFNKSKTAANDCRTNTAYISNGTAACSCWAKAAIGIVAAKKEGCSAEQTAKDVKAAKNRCFKAFSACKKAEDAAVGLIHTCMAGEVKNISATGTGTGRW